MNSSEIIKILRENEDYISGAQIAKGLGISRQAVSKHIVALNNAGFKIENVRGKGYILLEESEKVSSVGIKSRLNDRVIDFNVNYYDSIDSTNTQAVRLFNQNVNYISEKNGFLVVADEQTGGMGRRGRSFFSPPGESIYMSLLFRPKVMPMNVSCLTLVAAMAVYKAIKKNADIDIVIKWPNDILINGKKLCGILTQMSCETDFISYVVVGIGINVNNKDMPEDIKNIASSLFLETNNTFNREKIISDVTNYFENYYGIFKETGDLSGLVDEYNSYLINKDREVKIYGGMIEDTREEDIRIGTALGIDNTGSLLVKINGNVERIFAGEVSIR
ncbi:MAG: biotin--[acetyl-CoA-carboxylase] ligase [Lachnospiraceae bacterium]|nr:biotin--[acetyl-CoA-carboxylase] ligase [Lachnospiraceae bacterium]